MLFRPRAFSWKLDDFIMEKRDLSFVDTTSNRLERRNIIIKDKIVKFPGKRSIDVLVCLRSYFLLQNIDCLSRIKSKNDPGIKHKKSID